VKSSPAYCKPRVRISDRTKAGIASGRAQGKDVVAARSRGDVGGGVR